MATFNLAITLGNDAMQTGPDVAEALREAADDLDNMWGTLKASPSSVGIIDANGNRVGEWNIS